ncbi:MAG: phosphatidylglycerophosphatase A [Acidobacteria bacterium]|nr:phosphatidylglycerophosphatase A [Acidobacteriota bacterium]
MYRPRAVMSRLALPVATAGYVGLAPIAPGTWGSAVGLCLLLLVRLTGEAGAEALLLGTVLVVGVWSATVAERRYGRRDPGAIVIDEIAGMLITLFWVPVAWPGLVAGFLAFRFFDIVKPFPARAAERLPSGWGVMADDVVAGLYAYVTVRVGAAVAPSVMLG